MIGEIYQLFGRYNISPVLIKGLAAAQSYPKPFQRVFSDIDLAVDPKEYKTAQKIIREHNFNIDLHRGLRHLDTLDWETLFQNSEVINLNTSADIRILCLEDHLRVLCVHWLNDGGADRTRLWDIYFALLTKGDNFDWEKFYGVVGEHRRKWLMTVVLLVSDYFGLDFKNVPFEAAKYHLPGWVKTEIEKDWKNDTRLRPLGDVLHNREELFKQIKKRIPPNNLQAIIETEGEIRNSRGYMPRVKNIINRSTPSLKKIFEFNGE